MPLPSGGGILFFNGKALNLYFKILKKHKMATSTVQETAAPYLAQSQAEETQYISFEMFEQKYLTRDDGFKYEWNNGIVEKSPAMRTEELFIIEHLMDLFYQLKKKVGGVLTSEIEQWILPTKYRIPDLAYFTKDQIKKGKEGQRPVSEFMIEIISEYDQMNIIQKKIAEYFEAKVKVVWLILPQYNMVYVYTSPTEVKICADDTLCSAESVIEGFSIKANDLFKID